MWSLRISDNNRFLTLTDTDGAEYALNLADVARRDDAYANISYGDIFIPELQRIASHIRECKIRDATHLLNAHISGDSIVHLVRIYRSEPEGEEFYANTALCGRTQQRILGENIGFIYNCAAPDSPHAPDLLWCPLCKNIQGTGDVEYFSWPSKLAFRRGYYCFNNLGSDKEGRMRFHIRRDTFAEYEEDNGTNSERLYARKRHTLCGVVVAADNLGIRLDLEPAKYPDVFCPTCYGAYLYEQ